MDLCGQHAIGYRAEDVVARVNEITEGRGVDVILDPIGGKGFGRNFEMWAPLGMVISYGRLDGPPDPDLLSSMRAHFSKSRAVRFSTIHSLDGRPDIRGDNEDAVRPSRRGQNSPVDPRSLVTR